MTAPTPPATATGREGEVCDRCETSEPEPDSAFCWICALDYEDEQAEMRARDRGESLW